tara:strand:+ start:1035 stop:1646 length:612 start_codon:yes stop_codon:yes gene_type:complete
MISSLSKNNKLNEVKNSLTITYPRTVNIIYGNYPYPHVVHNFILSIKNNLDFNMENYTNVKGGMTKWDHFVDDNNFKNFITYLINAHQTNHPDTFKYFLERKIIKEAWGNEIKKRDSLNYHTHPWCHGILYLTKGSNLILPELNIQITPEPGDYYIFPPEILHGFCESNEEENRYSLVFNIESSNQSFNYAKKEKILHERKNS